MTHTDMASKNPNKRRTTEEEFSLRVANAIHNDKQNRKLEMARDMKEFYSGGGSGAGAKQQVNAYYQGKGGKETAQADPVIQHRLSLATHGDSTTSRVAAKVEQLQKEEELAQKRYEDMMAKFAKDTEGLF